MSISASRENLDDLDRRVTALEQDIGACACLSSAELEDWTEWRSSWRAELSHLRDQIDGVENGMRAASLGGILAVGLAETVLDRRLATIDGEADTWAAELGTWQRRAASKGASLTTPGEPPALGLPWVTIGVVALAAVVVGGGAYYLATRSAPRVKRNPRRRYYTVILPSGAELRERTKEDAVRAALGSGGSAVGPRGWLVTRGELVCD